MSPIIGFTRLMQQSVLKKARWENLSCGHFRYLHILFVFTLVCVYPSLMCWKRKLCQRKITQKDCKRRRLADPVILPLKTKWQPLLSLQWLRDPTKRPPTCSDFTHNYETTWPTSLREASSANRKQEKTQLFPDNLMHLTLSPWVQACLFPHTFISLFISCCYEFSRLSSFSGAASAAGRWITLLRATKAPAQREATPNSSSLVAPLLATTVSFKGRSRMNQYCVRVWFLFFFWNVRAHTLT